MPTSKIASGHTSICGRRRRSFTFGSAGSSFKPLSAVTTAAAMPVTLVNTIDTTGETDSPASQPMPKPVTTRAVMTPERGCFEPESLMAMLFSLFGLLRCLDMRTDRVQEEHRQPVMR